MAVARPPPAAILASVLLAFGGAPAVAEERRPPSWQDVKCARYAAAWTEALARFGRAGLDPDFVARHEAFLAGGCRGRREVCPRSRAELTLADALSIAAVNANIPGSFLPFACRD
jgi:hypothetical protein